MSVPKRQLVLKALRIDVFTVKIRARVVAALIDIKHESAIVAHLVAQGLAPGEGGGQEKARAELAIKLHLKRVVGGRVTAKIERHTGGFPKQLIQRLTGGAPSDG